MRIYERFYRWLSSRRMVTADPSVVESTVEGDTYRSWVIKIDNVFFLEIHEADIDGPREKILYETLGEQE